jgi:hypothetical protein
MSNSQINLNTSNFFDTDPGCFLGCLDLIAIVCYKTAAAIVTKRQSTCDPTMLP